MAALSALESCPPEIVESTAGYLSLDDLKTLRLASKTLATLVGQGISKQYYRTKHVDVTPASLRDLVQMTKLGRLGLEVENLVLVGLAIDSEHLEQIVKEKARWETEGNGPLFCSTQRKLTDDELSEAKESLAGLRGKKDELEEFYRSDGGAGLLVEAFSNIAAHGKYHKLPSLTLEVAVLKESIEKKLPPVQTCAHDAVWSVGEGVFRTVMAGLGGSGMPLQKLDAFTNQWRCSLGYSGLGCVDEIQREGLTKSLQAMQSLSLSLSADVKPEADDVEDDEEGEEQQEKAAPAAAKQAAGPEVLARFFALCPQLTHLHLHWFKLRSAGFKDPLAEDLLTHVVKARSLSKLHSLTLRGVSFKGPTLLGLLRSAPVTDLRLEEIHIDDPQPLPEDMNDESDPENPSPDDLPLPEPVRSQIWTAIFKHCTREQADMSSLLFDDLSGSRTILFDGEPNGRPKMPRTPYRQRASETLRRQGPQDVRRAVKYAYARGRPLGSPQAYNWMQKRQREYGPM